MTACTAKQKTPVASLLSFRLCWRLWKRSSGRWSCVWPIPGRLRADWRLDGRGGSETCRVVVFELNDAEGRRGLGEASPSRRYGENVESVLEFLRRVEPRQLSPIDIEGSMAYLETLAPGNHAAKGAVNIALCDLAARRAGKPLCDHLGLGFIEGKHVTSFSIGIDALTSSAKKSRPRKCIRS
jgi:L-alanine-DL-glutamate epimerase-like enolase superfamily enzyme